MWSRTRAVYLWVFTGAKIWTPFFLKKNGTSMHYPVASNRETALACFFHRKNVAALVGPALLAGAMRQLALVAVGALGGTGRSQKIVAAALGSPWFGMAPFWIRHCSIPLESSNQIVKTKISSPARPAHYWASLSARPASAFHRGSAAASSQLHFATIGFWPQRGHSPLQS